jgi:hypothetical protein
MIQIRRDTLFSSIGIFILYIVMSFLVILGFRFIFSGETAPLGYFFMRWCLMQGILDFINLFPALAMSALVIPFGFKTDTQESFARFSPQFLEKFRGTILTAIIASGIYGLLFFIALPLAQDSQSTMRFKGELFTMAKERVAIHVAKTDWQEARQFLTICDNIWPNDPAMEALRTKISVGVETLRFSSADTPSGSLKNAAAEYTGIAEHREPVRNAAEALVLAKRAMDEKRYYDAHWLASLALQLAKPGSMEDRESSRTASLAWNAIASMEPNTQQAHDYSLYRLKREGYEAMVSEDWIRAYYIFQELSKQLPDDPDVAKFLTMSEQGTANSVFFIDEIAAGIGETFTGAVFSIPLVPSVQSAGAASGNFSGATPGGRVVLRAASLTTFPDFSYAMGLELAAFDSNNRPLYTVAAQYAKLVPMTVRGKTRLVILLRALDRLNQEVRWEPVWIGGHSDLGDAQIALDTTYEYFLLLSKARRQVDSLFLADLLTMGNEFGNYGYIPQVFQAEIIRRIFEPLGLLPLTIFSIIIGWRFRAAAKSRYLGVPMLLITPLVFHGVVNLIRDVCNSAGLWALLSLGFLPAITIFIIGVLLLFILSLLLLASQHG